MSARDAKATLQNLKNLRPFVERNGDRKAIDAFNKAITAVKQQVALAERYERHSAYDSRSRRNVRGEAADFEASAARFHGKAIRLHAEPNASTEEEQHRAEDSLHHEESFDEAVERVRQEQLKRFAPKKRR